MRPLKDCEFTAFISYAHADDTAWFNWVTQFRNELERGLGALLRGVRLPRFHLSGENGPVAGPLSLELTRRVEQSFAMIIVVHDNYAQSEWCLNELAYFKTLFGDEGFRQRLYIVAMSEAAMLQVSSSAAWKALLPDDDQVWIAFYDPADKGRPLDIYMGPGLVAPAFRAPFERLRGDLAAKLKLAAAAPATASVPLPNAALLAPSFIAGSGFMPATMQAFAPPAGDGWKQMSPSASGATTAGSGTACTTGTVLVGFVPPATAAAAVAAVAALAQRGLQARLLTQDTVFTEFADLAAADHLVLAFDDAPPMMAMLAPGGHLALLRDAWARQGKAHDKLHWLDLRSPPPLAGQAQGGAAYVASLGVAALPLQALLDKLQPPAVVAATAGAAAAPPLQPVRIYIESNRYERTLWAPLGEHIRQLWDEVCESLAPGRVPQLNLRPRGLPVDQIDSFPNLDDADGVVLLWGRKTSDALVAQINKVENKMAPGRDAPPGIVAYLMPPQQSSEPVPAWGWQVLRFDASDEQAIDVVQEESAELRRFLQKVFERRQQRDAEGAR